MEVMQISSLMISGKSTKEMGNMLSKLQKDSTCSAINGNITTHPILSLVWGGGGLMCVDGLELDTCPTEVQVLKH